MVITHAPNRSWTHDLTHNLTLTRTGGAIWAKAHWQIKLRETSCNDVANKIKIICLKIIINKNPPEQRGLLSSREPNTSMAIYPTY